MSRFRSSHHCAAANQDLATRVIGITEVAQLDAALDAVTKGPLPVAAVSRLEALWANGFASA